jgi:glycosyltransferase involved in cell wall biosynthesis
MKLSDYSFITRLVFNFLKKLSHIPDVVVANSESGKQYHQMAGYRPKRWMVIPNGFNTQLFKPDFGARGKFRQRYGYTDNCPIIGMVARFDPVKDHALFFKVAVQLNDVIGGARFILIGKGMDMNNPAIQKMVKESGLEDKVALMGVQLDLHRIYPALDLLLCTSSSEGFPNVVGEALSCGVPVVATDVGDTARIVGPGGIVVPHGNPVMLTKACVHLLSLTKDAKSAISQIARNQINTHYSIDQICRQYTDLLTDLGLES